MTYMPNKEQPATFATGGLKITASGRALGADVDGFDFDALESRQIRQS